MPPAAPEGVQTPQLLGDGAQFLCGHRSKARDFLRIARAERLAQTLKVENVAGEGDDRIFIDKVTVQYTQETAHLDLLSGLLRDFPEERTFDRLSAFNAPGGQAGRSASRNGVSYAAGFHR